jgi:DNA-binding HxlR family transcriptional regulator
MVEKYARDVICATLAPYTWPVRTYGQFCALARGLDVIGDRWSLLIVRELLLRERRFGELRRGLPGVASNLLAERLRELEAEDVVTTVTDGEITRYRLTDRGLALAPVLRELIRWGAPAMFTGPGDDLQQGHWMVLALDALVDETAFTGSTPLLVQCYADGEAVWLLLRPDSPLQVGLGEAPDPDVVVTGSMHQCMAALLHRPIDVKADVSGAAARLREVKYWA